MIDFIIGDIVSIKQDYILIQNNGIGYKVFTSANSILNLEVGTKNQLLYTQLHTRDDGMFLYGFTSEDEIQMFNLLLKVSKIGPKIGIGILSTFRPNQIRLAVLNKDVQSLCKAPGIGKKTAERIILELKDRVGTAIDMDINDDIGTVNNDYKEAIDGLMSLGYSRFEIEKVISSMDTKDMSIEDMIRTGLRKLSSK